MVPNVTFLILNGFFGHRYKTQPRLLVSLVMVIVMFTFTSVMVKVVIYLFFHASLWIFLLCCIKVLFSNI